jgi:hypothetical protein
MATLSTDRIITLSDYADKALYSVSDMTPNAAVWPVDDSPDGIATVYTLLKKAEKQQPHVRVYLKQVDSEYV